MGINVTRRRAWSIHRSGVLEGSADADLAAATKIWASVIATYNYNRLGSIVDGLFRLPEGINKLAIRVRSDGADGDTCTAKLYLFQAKEDAKLAASIAFTIGLMQATKQIGGATTLYADQAVVTWSFPNTVSSDSTGANGDNMAIVSVDTALFEYALVLITASTMAGTNTKKMAVDIGGWS